MTIYGIKAGATLHDSYVFEDVPMSLAAIVSRGKCYGFSLRGMESIFKLGGSIHHTDYWRRRCEVECLGLDQWSMSELIPYVREGIVN
jgi:hypothetical protein